MDARHPEPVSHAGAPDAGVRLRPAQARVLAYDGGYMGVSAVPGAGKTFILSLLAAQLVKRIAREGKGDESEVLVVTFTNSAVDNFRKRIARFIRTEGLLLPGVGYTVRTLHALAHDIVRERPGLVGLADDFDIVDERTARELKRDLAMAWLRRNPDALIGFIHPDYVRRVQSGFTYFTNDMVDLANEFVSAAKNARATPEELRRLRMEQRGAFPLLDFGIEFYTDYERALHTRGAVDFDDLIVLALRALETAPDYLERLQDRWPWVLEDEAQDSSSLQEEMLRLLTRRHGNWVRVGDPNQAINTTFTTASAHHLRSFLLAHPEGARDLPNSGRSALPIIRSANFLIDWSQTLFSPGNEELALETPYIEPTPPDDPQPNPPPGNPAIYLHDRAIAPDKEREVVLGSLQRWLPENQEKTVAVLTPDNIFGFKFVEMLEAAGIPFDDSLLRADATTRAGAQALSTVVNYLAQPQDVRELVNVWSNVWWPLLGEPMVRAFAAGEARGEGLAGAVPTRPRRQRQQKLPPPVEAVANALRTLREPEQFIFPAAMGEAWQEQEWLVDMPNLRRAVGEFRDDLRRWSEVTILPIGELLITLGNDLFRDPSDLALAHRLAVLLDKLARENPGYRLPELGGELDNIAQNRRRVLGFSDSAEEFVARPGVVTVGTMHSAKGLEWDRVYLTAVNTFGFPSGATTDPYRAERFYVRDKLNLSAEMREQMRLLLAGSLDTYLLGAATESARFDLAAERLRLFYVGITRARSELIVSYNTGMRHDTDPLRPARAFTALREFVGE